ncbi:hypothetical protein [Roseimaritima multifibrata]|uniref:hypothetical protein n=1 Tax=Roseimaritima multifibrata TaxID=1930274 RepID=UPI0011A2DA83|nr:hypothetical protein [Roseimaritima multifibrata]
MNQVSSPLWAASAWSVSIAAAGETRVVTPRLPFARVGSHPKCEISLPASGLPDVAFLLIVHGTSAEAWPLALMEPAAWGPLAPEQVLSVGACKLTVTLNPKASSNAQQPAPHFPGLEFSGPKGRWDTQLKRPVTIFGSAPPSAMRLKHDSLAPCHGCFVSLTTGLWFLKLASRITPQGKWTLSEKPSLTRVQSNTGLDLGSVQVRQLAPPASKKNSAADKKTKAAAQKTSVATKTKPPAPQTQPSSTESGAARIVSAEQLTHNVTGSIVHLSRRRHWKRRLAVGIVLALVTFVATAIILQIWKTVQAEVAGWA